ncbi:MAG: CRTAC1 family protein [Planctomycetes bacterium]|nr:CRTAC1 family protein [Planctomycetota bacterium]
MSPPALRSHRLLAVPSPAPRLVLALAAVLAGCTGERGLTFVDRTAACGVTFEHVCGGLEKDYILEVNGGGVALFDVDGDSDLDVFFVNGSRFDLKPGEAPPSDALYRNDGAWRLTDVTDAAGLRESAWGCGCAVADVENDGDLDLYVTNFGPDELWVNDGMGSFAAAGASSGANDPGWGSSATFLDYDRDGLADLFVVNYLHFDRSRVAPRGPGSCNYKGQQILCGPVGFPPAHCTLYRNLGQVKFEDASEEAGIRKAAPGYGLGVVACDYDRDGWEDLYVAADTSENLLYHNLRNGTFEEVGMRAGVARSDHGVAQAGMGTDAAYLRDPRLEDIFVVNYEDDSNTYYRNDGDGFFTEITTQLGLAAPCFKHLGWGAFFADLDLDQDLDIFIAQGHVVPQADQIPSSPGYRQLNKVFRNDGSGRFEDASARCGPGLQVKKSSRGAACGDLDSDGDLDIVVNDIDDRATVLEAAGKPLGHWLAVRCVGVKSNRAAIGAVVRLRAGGREQARRIKSGSSYASHCEILARFGLGAAQKVDELKVEWPSGGAEVFAAGAVDRVLTVTEGSGTRIP